MNRHLGRVGRWLSGGCFGCVAVGLLWCASGPAVAGPERVIVGFKRVPDQAAVRAVGGRITHIYDLVPAVAAEIPQSMISRLSRYPGVLYVEPDYQVYATRPTIALRSPDLRARGWIQPLFDPGAETLPWGVARIGAPEVWSSPNVGEGIRVGIIDTGLDYTHPDLAGNYVLGYDFVNGDWDPLDDNGHGTHVAGIIAGIDDGPNSGGGDTDGTSVVGVAPQVEIYIAKSLDSEGAGYMSDIVAALDAAAKYGVDVVNMSLGSPFVSRTLRRACDRAYRSGVLLVAAAGNEGMDWIDVPARYSSVVSVGATDEADQRASFSNYSSQLELTAPGVGILSTMPTYTVRLNQSPYSYEQLYDSLSGTSMASPHVSGAAALTWAAHPDWSNAQVRDRLRVTAEDLGQPGRDRYFGYGLVDAASAAGSVQ